MQSRCKDLRLALLYKVVMGHVGIQPEHVGLVAADDRTTAKHQFKLHDVGSSTQALHHSFAVRTVGDWNSLLSHVVEQSTPASFKAELSRMTSATYARKAPPSLPPSMRYPRGGLWITYEIRPEPSSLLIPSRKLSPSSQTLLLTVAEPCHFSSNR